MKIRPEKRAFTLVELLVAMAIMIIALTLVVTAVTTISRVRGTTGVMKDAQQKSRIAIDMLTRLAREADGVSVPDTSTLILYFEKNNPVTTNFNMARFVFTNTNNTLYYEECPTLDRDSKSCTWDTPSDSTAQNLFSGNSVQVAAAGDMSKSYFNLSDGIPPTLNFRILSTGAGYATSNLDLSSSVVMENVR